MVIIIFPVLTFVLIVIAFLFFFIKYSNAKIEQKEEQFWQREKEAKLTPPVDLDSLAYINIPIDKFYFGSIDSPEVEAMEEEITEISKKPLLNLTGKTNTELSETYGAQNLETMKEIGDDFDKLTMVLVKYATALYEAGLITEAISVLEYGVLVKSDVSTTYTLLADCYARLGQKRRIQTLKEQVMPLGLLMGPVIIKHLDELMEHDDNVENVEDVSSSENISIE